VIYNHELIYIGRTVPLYNAALDPSSTAYISILQNGVLATYTEGSFLADSDKECEAGGCHKFYSEFVINIHKSDFAGELSVQKNC
jgi:hypothetical protein